MTDEKRAEFRGTYVIAAISSSSGFLARALVTSTREQTLEALQGAETWVQRARAAVESGKLPEGLTAPELRAPGPRLPLAPLDGSGDGS